MITHITDERLDTNSTPTKKLLLKDQKEDRELGPLFQSNIHHLRKEREVGNLSIASSIGQM